MRLANGFFVAMDITNTPFEIMIYTLYIFMCIHIYMYLSWLLIFSCSQIEKNWYDLVAPFVPCGPKGHKRPTLRGGVTEALSFKGQLLAQGSRLHCYVLLYLEDHPI